MQYKEKTEKLKKKKKKKENAKDWPQINTHVEDVCMFEEETEQYVKIQMKGWRSHSQSAIDRWILGDQKKEVWNLTTPHLLLTELFLFIVPRFDSKIHRYVFSNSK